MGTTITDFGRIAVYLYAVVCLVSTPLIEAKAASEGRCRQYAQSAVNDYNQLRNIPKCSKLRPQDTVRWHPQFKRHFDWCRTAQDAWLIDEANKRDELLLDCGGRGKL